MRLPEAFVVIRDSLDPGWNAAAEVLLGVLSELKGGPLGNVPKGSDGEMDDAIQDAILRLINRKPESALHLLDEAATQPDRVPDVAALGAVVKEAIQGGALPREVQRRMGSVFQDLGVPDGQLKVWAAEVYAAGESKQRAYLKVTLKRTRQDHLRDAGWREEVVGHHPVTGDEIKRWVNTEALVDDPLNPPKQADHGGQGAMPDDTVDARAELEELESARELLFEDIVAAAEAGISREKDRQAFRENLALLRAVVAGTADLERMVEMELPPRPPAGEDAAWIKERRTVMERYYTRFKRSVRKRILAELSSRVEQAMDAQDEALLDQLDLVRVVFDYELCIRISEDT